MSTRRIAAIALAWLAIGVTWACATGRYGGPDEPAHVLRAYAVAHGDVDGSPVPSLPSGYRAVTVPRSLGTGDPTCYRHDASLTSECSVAEPGDDTVVVATSAGVAPPWYYAMVGVPVRLLGASDDPLAYRLVALAWTTVVLTVACVRARGLGAAAPAFLLVVPPAAWFLLGVVTTNGLEVALAALAWVGIARLRTTATSRRELLWIGVPLGLAIAIRPIAAALTVAAIAVLVANRGVRSWRQAALVSAPSLAGGLSVLVWQRAIAWDGTDPRTATDVGVWRSFGDAVAGLPRTAGELVGTSGWLEISQPVVVKAAWALLLVASIVFARRREIAAWLAALVLTPVLFETVFADSIGPIWQGRYSLPVWIGAAAMAAAAVRRPGVALAAACAVETASFVVTVRRYAVGTDGSWWLANAADTSRWLTPRAWVVVHLVLMGAVGACLWSATRAEPDQST